MDLLVFAGLRSGAFANRRITLETGNDFYPWAIALVAKGKRAVVSTGWQGRLSVVDATEIDEPRFVRDIEVDGYVQQLSVIGDKVVAAMGFDGAMVIDLD